MSQAAAQTFSTNLLGHIQNIEFFSQLDDSLLQELAASSKRRSLAEGEYLFHQDDPGDDGMYIITEGCLRVLVTGPNSNQFVVDEHRAGGFVGEIAMLTGSKRTASVQAIAKTEVHRLSKTAFDRLVEKHPEILAQVSQIILTRLRRPQLISTLANIFGSLDLDAFEDVQAELTWLHLARGEQLIKQGEMDENLYLVISGRLQAVASDEAGREKMVGEITAGESVGEMQILTGEARSASVYAIRDSQLVSLSKAGFDRLVEKHPQMLRHISKLVIKRLQQTMRISSSTSKPSLALDLVLVPAGPEVPLTEFTQRLAAALEKYGSVLVLDSDRFDAYLGVPGAAQTSVDDPHDIRLAVGLNEQTRSHNFRLYQTDFSPTPWTRRCLRQADQVLIVGCAGDDAGLSDIEIEMLAAENKHANVCKRLILLHPEGTQRPTGTIDWLTPRQVEHHHHICWGNPADIQRLARFLTRRAIGLVLGSGGARGFAHIGVIRAIEELELEIDLIGGTSFGAMVGALYAMGYDYQGLYQKAKQLTKLKTISDYTIPFTSLLSGAKFTRLVKFLYGDVQIEDSWRHFFCVSSSLTNAIQNVHQRGPLWKHIRSSCSLPLVFPPSIYNGEPLADGGLINTVPLDVMQELNEDGSLIGVDVSADIDLNDNYQFDSSISGWQLLWNRLNPFSENIRAPSLLPILMRVTELQSSYRRKLQSDLADIYIRPPVDKFGTLEVEAFEQIIEIGYRTALPQLEAWLTSDKRR